jgi:hypothetical protein
MHTSPHVTCSKVLDTVRLSGLTYSLTETPYSAYLSIRKKFTKGFSPTTSSSTSSNTFSADTNKFSNDNQTQASEIEIANHNHTKYQLLVKEAELSKLSKQHEKLVNEDNNAHIKQTSSITKLTQELATEIDDHAQSEQALRRLEVKVETLQLDLNKQANENKALNNNIANSEETAAHYQKMSQKISESHVKTELKLTEALNADSGILNARVHELEGTVSGKNRIISLLKDQATISLREISDLRSKLNIVEASQSHHTNTTKAPLPGQLNLPACVLQTDTSLHVSQLGSPRQDGLQPDTFSQSISYTSSIPLPCQQNSSAHILQPNTSLSELGTPDHKVSQPVTFSQPNLVTPELGSSVMNVMQLLHRNPSETGKHDSEKDEFNNDIDLNANQPPKPSSDHQTNTSLDAEASDTSLPDSNKSTSSHITEPLNFCNNCHQKPDDLDMDLPPPIHEPSFIYECPSPWLHYGYCASCLEVARFESSQRGQGKVILEHIAQCPVLLDQCTPHHHEEHIEMYTEKENEIALKSHQGRQ